MELSVKKVKLENGEILAYREAGSGSNVLILVHGNMCSGIHFMPLIQRLPEDFKAYIVDLRGFGDSTYNNSIDSIKDLSDDLFALTNKIGIKKFTLVGWSAGGSICLQFSADYPELVKKIILIDSVGYKGCPLFKRDSQGKTLTGQVYKSKEEMAKDVEVAPCLEAIENKRFADMSALWNVAIYTNHKPSPKENELYVNATLKQRNLVDMYWALALFNMSDKHNGYTEGSNLISNVKAPVLSFWGEKDIIIPENTVRETVEALGDKAKMAVLKDSGHAPLIDCPELLVQKLVEFVYSDNFSS